MESYKRNAIENSKVTSILRIGLLDLVILQKYLPEAKQIYTRQFNIVLVLPFRQNQTCIIKIKTIKW